MDQEQKVKLVRQFMSGLPYARALALEVEDVGDGHAVISMPYDKALVGDPATGVIHGGVVSGLMDTTGGAAVMSHPSNPGGTATIDLRIDYMRAATPGQRLVARAEVYHITRSVAFVRAVALDDDIENPVATAAGAFTVDTGGAQA